MINSHKNKKICKGNVAKPFQRHDFAQLSIQHKKELAEFHFEFL
jgi:hypothetical protein